MNILNFPSLFDCIKKERKKKKSVFSLSSVAVFLKDDYFVRGAGLPGRFKAEKMEFHWGQSNGSAGSEHRISGRKFPVEVKTSCRYTAL